MVDERNYFINFLILTAPPLGGAVKAVFLPHLLTVKYHVFLQNNQKKIKNILLCVFFHLDKILLN